MITPHDPTSRVALPMEQQRPTLDNTQLYCDIIATLTIPRPKSASRVLRTNFVITCNYCSHTGNGVGRGSREAAKTLLYLSSVTDSLLSLPLG
jgi:hypothetical protein